MRERAALQASDPSALDEPLFWTPLVLGDRLSLELTLPAGFTSEALELWLVRLSHLFRLPFAPVGERHQWSARLPETGAPVVSVHHPHSQTVKIACGRVRQYWHCPDVAYCDADAESDSIHYSGVSWAQGLTSVVVVAPGRFELIRVRLVGVLTGGLSSRTESLQVDDFGRFDGAYRDGLWLELER